MQTGHNFLYISSATNLSASLLFLYFFFISLSHSLFSGLSPRQGSFTQRQGAFPPVISFPPPLKKDSSQLLRAPLRELPGIYGFPSLSFITELSGSTDSYFHFPLLYVWAFRPQIISSDNISVLKFIHQHLFLTPVTSSGYSLFERFFSLSIAHTFQYKYPKNLLMFFNASLSFLSHILYILSI